MAQDDALCAVLGKLAGQGGAVVVGQVPPVGEDAPLEVHGIGPVAQHLLVVVGLDKYRVGPQEPGAHLLGDTAHVGGQGENPIPFHPVAHALVRVVWRVKGPDGQSANPEGLSHRDKPQTALQQRQLTAQAVCHRVGGVNGEPVVLAEHGQPGNMIGVLMGDEHSADVLYRMTCLCQGGFHPAHGDSGVDQYIRVPAAEQQAVAAGAAGENGNLHQPMETILSGSSVSSGKLTTSMSAPRALSLPTKFS